MLDISAVAEYEADLHARSDEELGGEDFYNGDDDSTAGY